MMSWPDFSYKQIIVHQVRNRGEKIRFRADNIVIQDAEEKILVQHTCHRLFALFIIGEISMTSVLLKNSVKYSFPIVLLGSNLKVVCRINCVAEGNTMLRRRQYGIGDEKLEIAKELIRQKIHNQASLIRGLRRLSAEDWLAVQFLENLSVEACPDFKAVMGVEGNASRAFFAAYFRPLNWNRREPRCKRDIYNLLLDIGYTYLFQFIEALLSLYGFDLYCGVLHTFFYQRKSLVCDIVEPFRCIIDARIRKAHNLGQIDQADFKLQRGSYFLLWDHQEKYTRLFLKGILEYKEEMFKFCQSYYRWFMRGEAFERFPRFEMG